MVLTISISEEEWKLNPSFLKSSLKKAVTSLLIKELKNQDSIHHCAENTGFLVQTKRG